MAEQLVTGWFRIVAGKRTFIIGGCLWKRSVLCGRYRVNAYVISMFVLT